MKAHGKYKKTMQRKVHGEKSLRVHRLIVEDVLGKPLPDGSEVHHVNGNRGDNSHENLVVCPDKSYHMLLHARTDALEAGYDPDKYHKCTDCKAYRPKKEFSKNRTRVTGLNNLCKPCDNTRNRDRYSRRVGLSKL